MTSPSLPLAHELIRTACCAPSVHNTQPWSWRVLDATTIEQYADRSRQLTATDPHGRELAISCGAALHHIAVAAQAFGLVADVTLLPEPQEEDLFARIRLSAGHTDPESVDMLAALENRVTDRRGFTSWDVPGPRLAHLCEAAAGWMTHAVALTEPGLRHRAEELLEEARSTQAGDPRISEEQATWTDRLSPTATEGIPTANTLPRQRPGTTQPPSRFEQPAAEARHDAGDEQPADGLIGLCTARDDLRSWLQAGQAMSAVWLRATLGGLSATPASQVIEVDSTRERLQDEVFTYAGHPQILLRIGWQEVARPQLTRTPRRPLEDVLLH
jgi:hypothetical protein